MTNFGDPDFIKKMVKDLSRVFQLLKRSLPNVKVVEGMELICGKKYNLERVTAAATTCRAGDVIHPTSHTYAKMALHLLEAIAPQEAPRPGGSAQAGSGRGGVGSGGGGGASKRKRTHSECESLPRNTSRHTERSRNWAEQRRDQPSHGTGQHFYRGSGNAFVGLRGHGGQIGQFGRGGGGVDDRFQHSGGRRPYNRGWVPCGKRRN
jgi:hypothetical protein